MNSAPAFLADPAEPFAHHVHRLARGGHGAPISRGYVREDNALRKAAGKAWARPPEVTLGPDDSVEAALTRSECPPDDAEWFHHRWDLGEGPSVAAHAERIAAEANAFEAARPLLPGVPVRVRVSVALTGAPTMAGDGAVAAVAPGTHGWLVALASIGAQLARTTPLSALTRADRQLVWLNTAASALLRLPGFEPWIEPLLAAVGPTLMAPVGAEEGYAARLDALVGPVLEQPVGELQRMQKGLTKRRLDRLHRAWLRDFFVPRGVDLTAWIDGRVKPG